MKAKAMIKSGNWFTDLLLNFIPYPEDTTVTGSPDEMIIKASRQAFAISTCAGMIPGFLGFFSILPELIAVTKLQINLVYKLAKYYGKAHLLNPSIIFSIFATAMGVGEHRIFMRNVGPRIMVKALSSQAIRSLAPRIGTRISARIAGRRLARWIPVLSAPAFGYFSMTMTEKIAYVADEIFLPDMVIEEILICSHGHELPEGATTCPECGEEVSV
ncbi:MAG: zinc ribbon domain-containing protein [Deltaproteobacteria bacterium]|nr:zinc ribbon domain-containing protein [Deltaproteobacteria bacterium]